MKTVYAVVAMLIVTAAAGDAQDTVASRTKFELQVDACRFVGNDTLNYVELYYGIRENSLSYIREEGNLRGGILMRYEVRRDSAIIDRKEWVIPHVLDDTLRLAKNQVMTGMKTFGLPSGDYVISVAASDLRTAVLHDSVALALPIRRFPADREILSDIELCTQIQTSTNRQSLFYKNTLEVYPNPGKLYGAGLPILYYYLEAYNLASSGRTDSVTITSSVFDGAGKELQSQRRNKPRTLNASVEIGTINLSSLRSGSYTLRLAALDVSDSMIATSTKRFFIYKPGSIVDTGRPAVSQDVSDYTAVPEEALDEEFAQARYVASDLERTQYEGLTAVAAKRKFLGEFWQRRNPGPDPAVNSYKSEYMSRVEYAKAHLSGGLLAGWKSDRGRVYIVYGPPDEIERYPSESETLPYEIWSYRSLQGGVMFAFVDRTVTGDFKLVHSTHRDEVHFEDWYRQFALKAQ